MIPSWAYRLAARVNAGKGADELARVPAYVARGIRAAATEYSEEHARQSVTALGLALYWLSTRHPSRCNAPTTIAGLALKQLAGLTRNKKGAPYSISSVSHAWHGRDELAQHEPCVGTEGQRGFLWSLRLAGVLRVWVPNARRCAPWMLGPRGYAFCCLRAVVAPETEQDAQGPPSPS